MRFKEFLKEEKVSLPQLHIDVGLDLYDIPELAFKEIANGLKALNYVQSFTKDLEMLYIVTKPLSESDCRKIKSFRKEIIRVLTPILSNLEKQVEIEYVETLLIFPDGLPSFKVSYPRIRVDNPVKGSISGIEKLIGECESLEINECENIEGGVLSLFKLDIEHIELSSDFNPKWIQIIQQHLDHNRDILECREELIQAGLKDYAKL